MPAKPRAYQDKRRSEGTMGNARTKMTSDPRRRRALRFASADRPEITPASPASTVTQPGRWWPPWAQAGHPVARCHVGVGIAPVRRSTLRSWSRAALDRQSENISAADWAPSGAKRFGSERVLPSARTTKPHGCGRRRGSRGGSHWQGGGMITARVRFGAGPCWTRRSWSARGPSAQEWWSGPCVSRHFARRRARSYGQPRKVCTSRRASGDDALGVFGTTPASMRDRYVASKHARTRRDRRRPVAFSQPSPSE